MRLFIGIEFDSAIRRSLKDIQGRMQNRGIAGRYVPVENLHLTLAFIGEYSDPDRVLEVMAETPFKEISLGIDGAGRFRDLLWVGIRDNQELKKYVQRLRHGLSEAGIPFDRKRFSPHVTIVRKAKWHTQDPFEEITVNGGQMPVNHVTLFRSDRGKHGMIYTAIGVDEADVDDHVLYSRRNTCR